MKNISYSLAKKQQRVNFHRSLLNWIFNFKKFSLKCWYESFINECIYPGFRILISHFVNPLMVAKLIINIDKVIDWFLKASLIARYRIWFSCQWRVFKRHDSSTHKGKFITNQTLITFLKIKKNSRFFFLYVFVHSNFNLVIKLCTPNF